MRKFTQRSEESNITDSSRTADRLTDSSSLLTYTLINSNHTIATPKAAEIYYTQGCHFKLNADLLCARHALEQSLTFEIPIFFEGGRGIRNEEMCLDSRLLEAERACQRYSKVVSKAATYEDTVKVVN
jgi:hypothetical protein